MFMHVCLHLDVDVISWEPTNRDDYVAHTFFWILLYVTIRVFSGFDGLSSISDSDVMTK